MRFTLRAFVCVVVALQSSVALPAAIHAQPPHGPVHVLVLFGVPPEAPLISVFAQGLRRTVRDDIPAPVEFYEEYLDLDRFPRRAPQLAPFIADKYDALPIDAVVAVGADALRFAMARLGRLTAYSWIGDGIVGGAVIHHDVEGVNTGHLVTRVIQRPLGEALPKPTAATLTFAADARALKRWGLSESHLPPNTEVLYLTPTVWERYRAAILASLGLIIAETALIALLLAEGHRRRRAQLAIEDQNAWEQTMADLTTDAVRHAPQEAPRALEDALARVARYAGASRALVVQYGDDPARSPTIFRWPHTAVAAESENGAAGLRIPLEADDTGIGMLELHRDGVRQEWSPRLVGRLEAAAELMAGAIARARAARVIRQGEQLNRAVLASLSTQIAILDASGTIIRVNDAWRHVAFTAGAGVDRAAFLGRNYLDECLRAAERGCREARDVRQGIEAVLDGGTWHFRHEYTSAAPEERWYELRVDRLEYEDGGAIITHIDITDRRLAEIKAEETRRQLAHLGRVAMVGELAAAVSHELRQPLAAIRANAEAGVLLLSRAQPDVCEAIDIFRDIVDDDVRAANVIDHIRMLLRKDAPAKGAVDLNEVCRQAVHLLKRDALLRRTRLELSLESPLAPIAGDPVQLQQVVLNLALNALDSASTSTDDPAVTVSTATHGGEVEISVRDTGPGLAPGVEQHLFESFFSTKKQGLGMGLVIVRSIVERHHGRVRAENGVTPGGGRGAVFRVLLPIS